jgi:NAD(P)H-hydrate epimerase
LVGELAVVDIGIPAAFSAACVNDALVFVDASAAAALVPPRPTAGHKGTFGHLLVVAGSSGKVGAAALAAAGGLRSGAGLVTLAVPAGIHPVVEVKTTEVMTVPLAETLQGTIAAESLAVIEPLLAGRDVVALGPGLGVGAETAAVVRRIICAVRVPLVLDADALNALGGDLQPLLKSPSPALILTPHPGEMARLARADIAAIESDRLAAAQSFATANNCYLLLKGAHTVIAAPDGRLAINASGNPGMASGGMGDVLTGVIATLLGQGYEPYAACCLGAFCHGLAGDMAAADKGETGLIATDLQEMLPYAFKKLAEMQKLSVN